MSSKLCTTVLLSLLALVCASATPAFAGQEPTPATPTVTSSTGCGSSVLDLVATTEQAPACKPESPATGSAQPEFMVSSFRGYCQCGCSNQKNCNTDADCHGGRCLGGITCC